MNLWYKIKTSNLIVKIILSSVAVLVTITLLLLPILTVDAGETASRGMEHPGLAYMGRQDATSGIVLLGSVLVLFIVGGTLWVINQDRIHRPHLMKKSRKDTPQESEETA